MSSSFKTLVCMWIAFKRRLMPWILSQQSWIRSAWLLPFFLGVILFPWLLCTYYAHAFHLTSHPVHVAIHVCICRSFYLQLITLPSASSYLQFTLQNFQHTLPRALPDFLGGSRCLSVAQSIYLKARARGTFSLSLNSHSRTWLYDFGRVISPFYVSVPHLWSEDNDSTFLKRLLWAWRN